jgi:hypothetical protein
MFDIDTFLSLTSPKSKVDYLDSCEESTIELTAVDGSKYNKLLFSNDRSVNFALCKKKFSCNGVSILRICCNDFESDFQFIRSILEIYEKNNWLSAGTDEGTIIHELFSYFIYPRDGALFDYVIDLYDRSGIAINIIRNKYDTLEYVAQRDNINNFLRLLKVYKERNLHINNAIFLHFISRQYHKFDEKNTKLMGELINFCIENNIDIMAFIQRT